MDKSPAPSLLPIFRSQQQAELLALILGDPSVEHTLTDLAAQTGTPYASVHREIERAESAGITISRLVGRTRVVRANEASPYFVGLADVLVKAFGAPWVLANALADIARIDHAYIYGSWAARASGEAGQRAVGDIDLLVLGKPDRDALYAAASNVEQRLGRSIQITIRASDWLTTGSGTFYDTVVARPMIPLPPAATRTDREDRSTADRPRPERRFERSKAPTPSRRR